VPKERFSFICAVAQTTTVIELLESFIRNGCDIRKLVLLYEEKGTFEYD